MTSPKDPQRIDRDRTMADFGVQASNLFLYYDDLPRATEFYTSVLGVELLAEYDNASILRLATASYLILVDAAKGMHSTTEPKTVALALLTDQLDAWHDYLRAQNVSLKHAYQPQPGSAHDSFVAVDPEGYLLEFERFNQHPENERLLPLLKGNRSLETRAGEGLAINASVTWLYYKNLLDMESFFQEVLGLERVVDQGWAKIYRVTDSGYVGLVDEQRGLHRYTADKAVNVSFIVADIDGWFDRVEQAELFALRPPGLADGSEGKYRAFVGFDPEGYYLEFDRFFEHPDNVKLMECLKSD